MTTKTRWVAGVAVVAAMVAGSVGLAAARDGGASRVPGGMMGDTSMMSGAGMDAMHEQMIAALAGKVPSDVLARCDALHDLMWSASGGAG
jgi:hypothetical protein